MASKKIIDALNNHLNEELYSSYLYLSMAAYCEGKNLNGFAHWFKLQSQEEYGHGMRFYGFINQLGGKVALKAIKAPKTTWKSLNEIFKETLKHEQDITGLINKLVGLAMQEKDYATNNFLQWFVNEQVEEEATVEGILDKLDLIGDAKSGLFMLDRELGSRTAGN